MSSQNITNMSVQNFWKSKGQLKILGTMKGDTEEVPH
jgi:hypothetical protein